MSAACVRSATPSLVNNGTDVFADGALVTLEPDDGGRPGGGSAISIGRALQRADQPHGTHLAIFSKPSALDNRPALLLRVIVGLLSQLTEFNRTVRFNGQYRTLLNVTRETICSGNGNAARRARSGAPRAIAVNSCRLLNEVGWLFGCGTVL
jgi:hypothetical protein